MIILHVNYYSQPNVGANLLNYQFIRTLNQQFNDYFYLVFILVNLKFAHYILVFRTDSVNYYILLFDSSRSKFSASAICNDTAKTSLAISLYNIINN